MTLLNVVTDIVLDAPSFMYKRKHILLPRETYFRTRLKCVFSLITSSSFKVFIFIRNIEQIVVFEEYYVFIWFLKTDTKYTIGKF